MRFRLCRILALLALSTSAVLTGCGGSTAHGNPITTTYPVNAPAGSTVSVEFGTDTNYSLHTSAQPAPAGGGPVNIIVAGMRPETTYHMRARVVQANGEIAVDPDRTYQTGSLDTDNFPKFKATGDTSTGRGIELINLTEDQGKLAGEKVQAMATDLEGNIIWFYDHPSTEGWIFGFRPLQNGNFLLLLSDYASQSAIREVDLAGDTVREISLAALNQALQAQGIVSPIKFLHHDVLQLPNGHIIVLGALDKVIDNLVGQPAGTTVEGDVVIDFDANLKPAWVWSAFDHLDVNRHPLAFPPDWTHANALAYTADHNLLVSLRNQSWVIKIDYQDGTGTGSVVWRFGKDGDFTLQNGDVSAWQYAQHFPNILSESGGIIRLAVWDNGNGRVEPDDGACTTACFSRAVIYDIDETAKTATLEWEEDPKLFAPWGGSIGELENGNVEFDLPAPSGLAGSRVMEVTQTSNPQTIWQMDLSVATAYRAYRVPSLYPGVQW